jgi:hypothetical protein
MERCRAAPKRTAGGRKAGRRLLRRGGVVQVGGLASLTGMLGPREWEPEESYRLPALAGCGLTARKGNEVRDPSRHVYHYLSTVYIADAREQKSHDGRNRRRSECGGRRGTAPGGKKWEERLLSASPNAPPKHFSVTIFVLAGKMEMD